MALAPNRAPPPLAPGGERIGKLRVPCLLRRSKPDNAGSVHVQSSPRRAPVRAPPFFGPAGPLIKTDEGNNSRNFPECFNPDFHASCTCADWPSSLTTTARGEGSPASVTSGRARTNQAGVFAFPYTATFWQRFWSAPSFEIVIPSQLLGTRERRSKSVPQWMLKGREVGVN